MTAEELIESYLSDVVRLLPRRHQDDVALELRTLLREELAAKAAAAGRPGDDAMARDLLLAFGRPAEVAARYRPPSPALIDPADSRRFLQAAAAGVGVIWVLGLLDTLRRVGPTGGALEVLRDWWLGAGLQALWWPGFLVVSYATATWVRRRWPQATSWKPRPLVRERISPAGRVGLGAALVFFSCGTAVLVDPAFFLDHLTRGRAAPAAYQALAYDPDFTGFRGRILLPLMLAQLAVLLTLIVLGRWSPRTRQIDSVLTLAICGVLTWILFAGNVFQARPTDELVKAILVPIIVLSLIDAVLKLRRERRRSALLRSPNEDGPSAATPNAEIMP